MVAPPVKKPIATVQKTQSNGFDIDRFSQDFAKMQVLQENRQAEERNAFQAQTQAQKDLLTLGEESLGVKQDYLDGITPLVEQSKQIAAAAQRQQQLQSSGSLIDQLQAMQDAMLNPGMATSDGRAKRRAELNAQASTLATLAEANQNVISTKMDLVKMGLSLKQAGLEEAKMLENQHGELMKAEAIRVETIRQGLQSNAQAQQLILDQMTPEQIIQERQKAGQKDGKVNISGFDIPSSVLDSELAKRQAVQYDLQTKALAIQHNNQEMIKKANERILAALSVDQLSNLKMGNPLEIVGEGGQKTQLTLGDFDLSQVNAHYESKQQAFNDKISEQNNAIMFGDTRQSIIVPASTRMDALLKRSPPGSNEYNYAKQRIDTLAKAKRAIDHAESQIDPKNPYAKIAFDSMQAKLGEVLQKDDEKDAKIIESAAKTLGRGDKDLTNAAREYLAGDTVSQQSVVDYVTRKAANNEDVSQMLGPDGAKLFMKKYNAMLADYRGKQNDLTSALMNGDRIKEKEYKQTIAYDALMATAAEMSQGHTDGFIGAQAVLKATDPNAWQNNPISQARDSMGRKLFDSTTFLGFVKDADNLGETEMLKSQKWAALKLSPDEIQKLKGGQDVMRDGVTVSSAEYTGELYRYQNVALLRQLDSKQVGLASKYVHWWEDNGTTYANEYVSAELRGNADKGTLQNSALASLSSDAVINGIETYRMGISQAYDAYLGDMQTRRKEWTTFGLEPGNRQAMLLQLDSKLSDEDRTTIFKDLIAPVIAKGKQANADYYSINSSIEDAIADPSLVNPNWKDNAKLKTALSKLGENRQGMVRIVEEMMNAPWLHDFNKQIPDDVWGRISDSGKNQDKAGIIPTTTGLAAIWDPNKMPRVLDPAHGNTTRGILNSILPGSPLGGGDYWLGQETQTQGYSWYQRLLSGSNQ